MPAHFYFYKSATLLMALTMDDGYPFREVNGPDQTENFGCVNDPGVLGGKTALKEA